MSTQAFRCASGGLIDRSQPISFTFDGKRLQGYAGDTLASALLANGVRVIARSFKYHRPRGVFGVGPEEPNALVTLRSGARHEPNLRATQVELFDGLEAFSQNCWPSARFDVGAVLGWFSAILPSGFYYKTFMWPRRMWPTYERVIRSIGGMGHTARAPDPDRYAHHNATADVLIIGSGPAGLAAAQTASKSGARVLVVEQDHALGGSLLGSTADIDGQPAVQWLAARIAELAARPNVTLLPRAVAFGVYDDGLVGIVEKAADHLPMPRPGYPRQRLWKVRVRRIVLAAGSIEQPIVFPGNDVPGVMLTSAVRTYLNRYGVLAGRRAVVFTNDDSAYPAVAELATAGIEIAAVVDLRSGGLSDLPGKKSWLRGCAVVGTRGRSQVTAAVVAPIGPDGAPAGNTHEIPCDLICVSGGWTPTVHLYSIGRGRLAFDADIGAFLPTGHAGNLVVAGAAAGRFGLAACLEDGTRCGQAAADDTPAEFVPPVAAVPSGTPPALRHWSPPPGVKGKAFVDLQNDVTVRDIRLAVREGYVSVEHLKRYTTLGMGTDQGRTSNQSGLGILARALGKDIGHFTTTTFRPPFTPVTLGALAGLETGDHVAPLRRTPMHDWHVAHGVVMGAAGLWHRPQYYLQAGETVEQSIAREAGSVRAGVGLTDVSTLGKIEVQGPDAAALLERVYASTIGKLGVGRCRYGIMLRDDGFVFDDGTVSRLAEHRFVLTTTTTHLESVLRHIERCHQVYWPDLRVRILDVTEQWGAMAIAGPKAREVLSLVCSGLDISNTALPHMRFVEGTAAGVPVRIFRISFSGELSYEVNVPARAATRVWEACMAAGKPFGITPYGLEAMATLRIEKGYPAGSEINGRMTADDLGLGKMVRRDKNCIGARSLGRPGLCDPARRQLVGLMSEDGRTAIPRGAQIVADPEHPAPNPSLGEVTSRCVSPVLKRPIALALVSAGRNRLGERLFAVSPIAGQVVPVVVREPVFVDLEGARLHA